MSEQLFKPKKKYVQITCMIESDLLEQIKYLVEKYELGSVRDFIIQCVQYSVDNFSEMQEKDDRWIQRREFQRYFGM